MSKKKNSKRDRGKKRKKYRKKPRQNEILIASKEPLSELYYDHDKRKLYAVKNGQLAELEAVYSRTYYERQSGKDKVLSQLSGHAIRDVESFLSSKLFDVLFVIDTNTKSIKDNKISIGSIIECNVDKVKTGFYINPRSLFHIIFKNCPDNQEEKFAWFKLVNLLKSNAQYKNFKIVIITDHDLNNHAKFNSKELPIYSDYFLPDNFKLMYASSDKIENIFNKLISQCDKQNNELLEQLQENYSANINGRVLHLDEIESV